MPQGVQLQLQNLHMVLRRDETLMGDKKLPPQHVYPTLYPPSYNNNTALINPWISAPTIWVDGSGSIVCQGHNVAPCSHCCGGCYTS
jgi:hypothetical protein